MKIGLVTTTINLPKALSLYRAKDDALMARLVGIEAATKFFVAIDQKTPHEAINFCQYDITDTQVLFIQDQQKWKCSKLLGWNTICRRNIALLEAIAWGSDIVVFCDDDNLPLGDFFYEVRLALLNPFSGVKVSSRSGWFDAGQLLTPAVRHRGFPMEVATTPAILESIIDVQIGVAAGLWIGDADVNSVDRIAIPPAVHSATALALEGVVVAPETKTVFNAQNVSFIRELAPALFQAPGLGRADDIFASLITQRIMRERGLHVRFGKPFTACWQNRSKASLLKDLADEMLLLERTAEFSRYLDGYEFAPESKTVLEQVHEIYQDLQHCAWWPSVASEAAFAFCDDIEGVL